MNAVSASQEKKTDNGAVAYDWGVTEKASICDIFNMTRGANEEDIVKKLPMAWNYGNEPNGTWFVALMFFMRNIRKNTYDIGENLINVSKGKGEKLLSYYMALWLLKHFPDVFNANYIRFVQDMGYYKDCLILAKMAKERKYSDNEIRTILMPMAISLIDDENKIIKKHLSGSREKITLTLASKWAPREGKAFSYLIPYLKQLCNITGAKSDMRWRIYIRQISRGNESKTIESLLSTKQYDLINFKAVPSKAFNLYKNAFMRIPELSDKFVAFLNNVRRVHARIHVNAMHPHELLNTYLSSLMFGDQLYDEDSVVESQWKCYIDNALNTSLNLERIECNFIPMIDLSDSMFVGNALPAKVAITLGITMGMINMGIFHRKAITFSSNPMMADINGDTAFAQINSLFEAIKNVNYGSRMSTNIVKAFDALLEFILANEIPSSEVEKLKILILSDMEFDSADESLKGDMSPLECIRMKYAEHDYTTPQIVFWNLNGHMEYKPCQINSACVSCLGGFEPSIIEAFLESGELDPTTLPLHIIRQFIPLVNIP